MRYVVSRRRRIRLRFLETNLFLWRLLLLRLLWRRWIAQAGGGDDHRPIWHDSHWIHSGQWGGRGLVRRAVGREPEKIVPDTFEVANFNFLGKEDVDVGQNSSFVDLSLSPTNRRTDELHVDSRGGLDD